MPFNEAGIVDPLDFDMLSIHQTNPGVGASPAGGSEISGSPYARQSVTLAGATTASPGGTLQAQFPFDEPVVFDIPTGSNQNCAFVGVWKGSTYKGYFVPNNPKNFTDNDSTARSFTVTTASFAFLRNEA